MKKYQSKDFTRGWMVGDFTPAIIRTRAFEFMVRNYSKGDKEQRHMHKIADEITVVVSGKFRMNEEVLDQGDIVHLLPGDASDFECMEDGAIAVVKTPSAAGDKYLC
jgi:quercetin dioxygenase-like cupin family protein